MRIYLFFVIIIGFLLGCTNSNYEENYRLVEKGDAAFYKKEYLRAADSWNKAYLNNQTDVSLMNKLGDCYLKLGRLERAKLFFLKAVEKDPENIDIQIKLAQIYILSWDLPEADKICKMFRKEKGSHPELDLIRADLSLMMDHKEEAEAFYRNAIIGSNYSLRALMKLAIFLKSVSKDEEALKILEIVKKSIVIPSKIYLLMSDYYLIDDQYDQAEQSILDAIRIEPEDMSLKYHLVQFHIATENNSKAESILETILKNQEDIYLKMMLSDVYILNNKLNKAEKIILELKEEIKESTTEFELLQGKFWLYSGRPVDATSHFKSALELKPGLVNVRYLLGLTHLINEKNKLSENTLVRTLQIHPNHYNALLLISELFYKKKEYSLSLQYLDRLLENYPEDFTGYIIKGLNLLGQKKYSLAKKEFATSLHLSSRTYASYYYLGMTEELMDNDIAALEYYKQVLKIDPDLIDASYRYCMLLLKMKQNKTANDFIDKRLTIRKNSPEVYYLAGKVAQKTGNLSKAEEFLKKAIQFYSAPGFVYMELASFYKNNHEIQKAIEILKQCTVRKPYFQDAWLVLCEFYVDSQDLTTALEIMQEGYKKFQGSPIFQSNLAWLLLEDNQQINKAFSLAQSAYEKMPDNIAFADTLGWAYYKKGIYSQAIWLLSEIEKKEPDNGLIQYHLGMTYYQQGEIEKTIEHLKIAQKSESVKYFLHEIDRAFSEISKINKDELEIKIAVDKDSILLPPEIENVEDNKILPQWK